MKKICKQKISPDFIPIAANVVHVGKVLTFDCYIKRFNDYVVIVKAGTLITPELYENINQNRRIYVSQREHAAYKTYCQENVTVKIEEEETTAITVEEAVEKCLSLSKETVKHLPPQEKMQRIYNAATDLMLAYDLSTASYLPLDALNACIDAMLDVLMQRGTLFGCFSTLAPEEYSFQTHAVNVSLLAAMIGHGEKLNVFDLRNLTLAALLHDIGKKNIPKSILEKDGPLKEDEFETVRQHPGLSVDLLRENNIVEAKIISAVKFHHERLDGSGYPVGLKGRNIPMYAQIIGVCDVFDALTTERTFRAKYSSFDALVIMKRKLSEEINGKYVDALIRLQQRN